MLSPNIYRLRSFMPSNPGEIERMNLMYYHPQVRKVMGWQTEGRKVIKTEDLQKADRSMKKMTSLVTRQYSEVSYAVADIKDHLIGWIWFCHDSSHPLPQRVAKRLGVTPYNSRSYQVVYEKLLSDGWPKKLIAKTIHVKMRELQAKRKGVIVEGLRLAILRLSRAYRKLYLRKRTLVLYAYVIPSNKASQKVLLRNKFTKEMQKYRYDGISHDLWIRAI